MTVRESHPVIALTGYYGHGNLGDDLLMQIIARRVADSTAATVEIVTTGENDASLRLALETGLRARPFSDISQKYDGVILGGGGLFFDTRKQSMWRLPPFAEGAAGRFMVRARGISPSYLTSLGSRAFAIGVGIGPFGLSSRRVATARAELARCDEIWVRDDVSMSWCQADPLLADRAYRGADLTLGDPNPDAGEVGSSLVLVPRYSMHEMDSPSVWVDWFCGLAARAADAGIGVRFLSLCQSGESGLVSDLRSSGFEALAYDGSNMNEVLDLLSSASGVVSMRLHGLLLGQLAGASVYSVGSDPKLTMALPSRCERSIVSPTSSNIDSILEDLRPASLAASKKEDMLEARDRANRSFDSLNNWMDTFR